jgi:3-dehydroquinate dehydratase-2
MFPGPIIELHISNIHRREPIYHRSYVSPVATAVIAGLGTNGYPVAVQSMVAMIAKSTAARASA